MPSVLAQNPTKSATAIQHRLIELLRKPGLERFRASVAYVKWSGLGALADPLEDFLERGGTVESIFGIDNGVTTPDALLYAVYLRKEYSNYRYAGVSDWNYSNSIFHPKYYEFRFQHEVVALVGSANLTGGGLHGNHELSVEVEAPLASPLHKQLEAVWTTHLKSAKPVTAKLVSQLSADSALSYEHSAETPKGRKLPRLKLPSFPAVRPPLFKRVLQKKTAKPPHVRHEFLAEADSLSEKPRRLYLQILHETGGGHQVQLPVATLGSFFGVGPGQTKQVTFEFQSGEPVTVHLTHFGNNTHRVRLLPIRGVPRPAILVFERQSPILYRCRIVPPAQYKSVLMKKCTEQTRRGSRRWGLES